MIKEFIFLLEVNFDKLVKIILVVILEMFYFWILFIFKILFYIEEICVFKKRFIVKKFNFKNLG